MTTILQRDVRDLSSIEDLSALPRLLALLAARSTTLQNYAELSRSAGIPATTLKRYFLLLEATFLIQTLPAWSANLSKRLVKSPKILLTDTGLLASLLGLYSGWLDEEPRPAGPLLENFILMEVRKQISWSRTGPKCSTTGHRPARRSICCWKTAAAGVAGIEVKAGSTVQERDVRVLLDFAEILGNRFLRGVVLYTGDRVVPFSEKVFAMPVQALWS